MYTPGPDGACVCAVCSLPPREPGPSASARATLPVDATTYTLTVEDEPETPPVQAGWHSSLLGFSYGAAKAAEAARPNLGLNATPLGSEEYCRCGCGSVGQCDR
jgi:hypothetical protein